MEEILKPRRRGMEPWRYAVLVLLFLAPVFILVGFGFYYLWQSGLAFWMWWLLSGFLVAGMVLSWYWQKRQRLLPGEPDIVLHWTERDKLAWKLVADRAARVKDLSVDRISSLSLYVETAEAMAAELAAFYHPGAKDPVGSLTLPEMLAVVELASHDLGEMVDRTLPGGHFLTIDDMRRFKTMASWYQTVRNVTWIVSGIFSPVSTAIRYFASQAAMGRPWQMLQDNLLVWFFTAFVHRLGVYLIDLNSGRLRVGARRYLELQRANVAAPDEPQVVRKISLAIIGQTKAGKSSLINALLGEQRAHTDVVPATASITRYELHPPNLPSRLHLLDTVGYGNEGVREDRRHATENAARQADVILLVIHARNPARQTDVDMVKDLADFYQRNPELRKPPLLAVMTHIDLLSPSMEWAPPYNLAKPERTKEKQIKEATAAALEQFGQVIDGVIPVCTAPGKVYGVAEWLLPAIAGVVDQAHAVAFLRVLKAEVDGIQIRKVLDQFLGAGQAFGSVLREQLLPVGQGTKP